MRPITFCLTLIAVLVAVPSRGQTFPNFSGTWALVDARDGPDEDRATQLTIVQTPTAITVEQVVKGEREVLNYPFTALALPDVVANTDAAVGTSGNLNDDKKALTDVAKPDLGGPSRVLGTRAEWKDGVLETTAVLMISGRTVTERRRRTLNAEGNQMTVSTLLAVQHGYQAGNANSSDTQMYRKVE